MTHLDLIVTEPTERELTEIELDAEGSTAEHAAASLLMLAQRTADALIAEAVETSERILREARQQADLLMLAAAS